MRDAITNRPSVFLVAICLGWVLCSSTAAANERLFTFDDLKEFAEVQSMDLSPDGRQLAYTVSWEHPELWLIETKPGSAPSHIGSGQFPRWAPNGKYLAYYSRRSGALQLWIYRTHSRDSVQVTNVQGGIDP